jgi:DNA-binding NarL/FixJ family response regulator
MVRARVLVADDHPEMRERIADLLHLDFDTIAFAADGQQAIESALQLTPDIVVLDIWMPVLNGLQVASHLQNLGCAAKLIFLTVHRDPDIVEAAFAAGALGYVLKPRIVKDLIPAIQEALAGRRFTSPFLITHRPAV